MTKQYHIGPGDMSFIEMSLDIMQNRLESAHFNMGRGYERTNWHLQKLQEEAQQVANRLESMRVEDKLAPGQRAAQAYADRVAGMDNPQPCRYGHLDCATREGGKCVDEVMTLAGL